MFSPSPHSARLSERAHADWIGIESIENENGKLCSHNTASIETIETVETYIETADCPWPGSEIAPCLHLAAVSGYHQDQQTQELRIITSCLVSPSKPANN